MYKFIFKPHRDREANGLMHALEKSDLSPFAYL